MKRVFVALILSVLAITMVAAQVPLNLFTRGAQGQNGVVATAKLTTLGTNGSMTFVDGQLTASTPAT